jgi:D-amino-acid dehydrogenase
VSTAGGEVVVIGGGVIGAACAYYLSRAGWKVTVLDRGAFGGACSHGNCGFVCPSHVLPLAAPGAVGAALRAMLRPNAPLHIKPRFDPALWGWLYRFARRCNRRDMLDAGRAIQALLNSSRRLYDDLIREEAIDCEWQTRGMLFVFLTRSAMEHYAETDRLTRDEFGLSAKRYDGDAVAELEPALKSGLGGGWLYDGDAYLRPDRLMAEWRRVLEARGVVVRDRCDAVGFVRDGGRACAVRINQGAPRALLPPPSVGEGGGGGRSLPGLPPHPDPPPPGGRGKSETTLSADAFVVAAGALSPTWARELGCRIPIQPGKGYSITMPRPARCPKFPLIFEEHRVAVTPFRSGYRLGSTMEFAGYDATLNRRRLDLLRDAALHYLHEPYCDPVQEEWFGWRPMTYDGKPLIGRAPALTNVVLAAGHNMLGLSMAPATGRLVAEMLAEEPPHLDLAPYSPLRF